MQGLVTVVVAMHGLGDVVASSEVFSRTTVPSGCENNSGEFRSIVPNALMVLNSIRGVSGSITIAMPSLKPATLFVLICVSPCCAEFEILVDRRSAVVEDVPTFKVVEVVDVIDNFCPDVVPPSVVLVVVTIVAFGSEVVLATTASVVDTDVDTSGPKVVVISAVGLDVVDIFGAGVAVTSGTVVVVCTRVSEFVVVFDVVVNSLAVEVVEAVRRTGKTTDATWISRGTTDESALRIEVSDISNAAREIFSFTSGAEA